MQLLRKYRCPKNMSGLHPHGNVTPIPYGLMSGLGTGTDLIISGHVSSIKYYKHCWG